MRIVPLEVARHRARMASIKCFLEGKTRRECELVALNAITAVKFSSAEDMRECAQIALEEIIHVYGEQS